MTKYDHEFKLMIVKENLEGYGRRYLSKKYNLKDSTIEQWIIQYKMYGEEGIEKSMYKKTYTGEFKFSVLKYRQNYQLSYRETAKRFNIKNLSTIANWQRTYLEKGFEGLCGKVGRPRKNGDWDMPNDRKKPKKLTKYEREELIELRQRNQYLEAENLYLKKLDVLLQEKKLQTKKIQN